MKQRWWRGGGGGGGESCGNRACTFKAITKLTFRSSCTVCFTIVILHFMVTVHLSISATEKPPCIVSAVLSSKGIEVRVRRTIFIAQATFTRLTTVSFLKAIAQARAISLHDRRDSTMTISHMSQLVRQRRGVFPMKCSRAPSAAALFFSVLCASQRSQ